MMTDLQAIDLILSIALKILFIIFLILGTAILFQVNNVMRQMKERVEFAVDNLEMSMRRIEMGLSPENIFRKVRYGLEKSANFYLLNVLRKEAYSVVKKFLR